MKTASCFFVIAVALLAFACSPAPASAPEPSEDAAAQFSAGQQIARGKYLVEVGGCHDCHSPKKFGPMGPEPDPERLLSGHPRDMPLAPVDTAALAGWVLFNHHTTAAVGPWGVSFAANLTSDVSGIGEWSEAQFIKAIREGKLKGLDSSRPLLPPMPWPGIAKMTDEDLKAIFAYLKSTKPVHNVVPPPMALSDVEKTGSR